MNVLLVAEESAGIQVLGMLTRSSCRIAAVMTAPPTRGGGATVATVAASLDVPVLPSMRVREPAFADWIRHEEIDLLLNVHSLHVIHADVLRAPRIGSFNLHPGPLPEYAGLNVPSWAIYRGEQRHAVTLHWMEAGIDSGAIAYERWFNLTEADTGLSVSARCVREGLPLVSRLLDAAAQGGDSIPAQPQDLSRRRYFRPAPPDGGRIVWSQSAGEIVALVRACDYFPFPSPWGHARARVEELAVSVTKASRTREPTVDAPGTVAAAGGSAVRVATGDEWVLIHRVKLNAKPLGAADVLAPGGRLEDGR